MLRFYVDHNVHAGITAGLRRRGIGCLTALEDGMADVDDECSWTARRPWGGAC